MKEVKAQHLTGRWQICLWLKTHPFLIFTLMLVSMETLLLVKLFNHTCSLKIGQLVKPFPTQPIRTLWMWFVLSHLKHSLPLQSQTQLWFHVEIVFWETLPQAIRQLFRDQYPQQVTLVMHRGGISTLKNSSFKLAI